MRQDPTRTPVIVGVGEINDRPAAPEQGLDSVQLMLAALQAADADAGGGFLARCDRLYVVPQISFRQLDPAELLARALGLPPERIRQAEQASGDTPIRHLNDAANAIASGEAEVCLVTGGEALRTAAAGPARRAAPSCSRARAKAPRSCAASTAWSPRRRSIRCSRTPPAPPGARRSPRPRPRRRRSGRGCRRSPGRRPAPG